MPAPVRHRSSVEYVSTDRLDVMPGSRLFDDVESLASGEFGSRLDTNQPVFADDLFDAYDFVLMDCPPSLGS